MKLAALLALFALTSGQDPTPVDYMREKFYELELGLWKNVTDSEWINSGLGGDVEVTKKFTAFTDEFATVLSSTRLPHKSWLWTKVEEKLRAIEKYYKDFEDFIRKQSVPGAVPAPVREWLDLADNIVLNTKTSVSISIKKLNELLDHVDIYRATLQEDHPELCELQLSPHQVIYDMYNTISLTEIKGYAMMQFSWMLLRIYGKGNYTQEANLTRQRYGERSAKTAAAAKSALTLAKRDMYRCDPPIHQEGVTYAEVTRLLQGYIENEVDLNAQGTCKENCAFYSLAENHGCFKDMYCARQTRCNGRILDCQYIDSDMWICPAGRDSNRRYEFIEYENRRVLGHAGSCMRGRTKVDSWWRWLFWHCSYCMCLCDETGPKSHRYFSLREATSDAGNNKVVTGVKLIKEGRMFHLQVSEGTLGERGKIAAAGWVPVQKFDPHDPGVRENVDYHELTYEKRAIDLDELDSPSGHILTGVRFRMHGPHLHFEIRSTPFNYTSGRLNADKSQWISNDNTDGAEKPRTRLQLYTPDIPTRFKMPQPVDSKHDQFIEFTNTDFDADAAQSTVPFIDIQPVYPLKGTAMLSGAGIIHRGMRRSGGFLAVKVFTYDYSKHVKATLPPSDFEDVETTDFTPMVN